MVSKPPVQKYDTPYLFMFYKYKSWYHLNILLIWIFQFCLSIPTIKIWKDFYFENINWVFHSFGNYSLSRKLKFTYTYSLRVYCKIENLGSILWSPYFTKIWLISKMCIFENYSFVFKFFKLFEELKNKLAR